MKKYSHVSQNFDYSSHNNDFTMGIVFFLLFYSVIFFLQLAYMCLHREVIIFQTLPVNVLLENLVGTPVTQMYAYTSEAQAGASSLAAKCSPLFITSQSITLSFCCLVLNRKNTGLWSFSTDSSCLLLGLVQQEGTENSNCCGQTAK